MCLLYDFSTHVKKRVANKSAKQIKELVPRLNEPGVVIEFKQRVENWLLYHEVLTRTAA